jgi:hypothetical protein
VADGGTVFSDHVHRAERVNAMGKDRLGSSRRRHGAHHQQARDALAAGAQFIIAPNTSAEVARVALDAGVLYCPGAYTTSEILAARALGAHVVKVYPVGVAGGPSYIQVIRDPLPDVPMLAAGGTNLDNVVRSSRPAAWASGSAALTDAKLVAQRQFAAIWSVRASSSRRASVAKPLVLAGRWARRSRPARAARGDRDSRRSTWSRRKRRREPARSRAPRPPRSGATVGARAAGDSHLANV